MGEKIKSYERYVKRGRLERERERETAPSSFRLAMPTLFDRVNAGIARFAAKDDGQREVDVAFVKACNHDPGPPKEKHVRKLLQVTSIESCETQEYLVASIERKLLGSKDCQVVAKCLLIVHRLLKDGSWYFKEIFYKGFAHIFDHLGNFKDDTNRVSWQLSTFIRAYSAFLHHRSVFFTSFAYEHELDRAKTLDVESLISELPVMQNCIDLGLQVVSSKDIVDVSEPTQDYARNLVLADVLALSLPDEGRAKAGGAVFRPASLRVQRHDLHL